MIVPSSRRPTRLLLIAAVLAVILFAAAFARFYTDVLWFQEVGFSSVLWKSLGMQFAVGTAVGLAIALVVWLNLLLAERTAPAYPTAVRGDGRFDALERYRDSVLPHLKWLRLGIAAALGLLMGLSASAGWQTVLLWANRVRFGTSAPPPLGRDVAFYVFELPLLDLVLSWLWIALFAALVVSVAAHYLLGSIRPEAGLRGILPGPLAHISVLLGLLALVKAGQYWLGQYELNFSPRGVVTGASYTDIHAQLPALRVLVFISLVSAALFLVNIRLRRLSLPLAAVGIWILISFLAGGVWPWWVQRFSVEPQELQRERPYIAYNIEATRRAFDLEDVEPRPFPVSDQLPAEGLDNSALQNVRVWDPGVLRVDYSQLQAIRTYYAFEDVDIDRYEIDGETRQVLVSGRELSLDDLESGSKTWINLHLQFTHGFGMVASLANESTASGQPQFLVKDVPGKVTEGAEALDATQKRIYYGEAFQPNEYSVVNSRQEELDYPLEEGVRRSRYEGQGGIPVSGLLKRLAFAIREGDPNLVLSGLITGDSRIQIYKNVRDRVLRAAPFLSLDQDPYLAVVDDRLVWILDAYTSTPWYPYSQRFDTREVVAVGQNGVLRETVNYLRNSVKVAVDAYDGTMAFYVIDEDDPLIQAWNNAFPELFADEAPSEGLTAHFRYPEDLFRVQSDVYRTYHMTNAADFYSKEDAWSVPEDEAQQEIAPTYLLIKLPGETEEEFVLTRPFTPRERDNMIALMAARSDPGVYGGLVNLLFPRQKLVAGPVQVANRINQDTEISRTRTLLGQEASEVFFGSLIVLPIENSILYVQPFYVTAERATATGDQGIPELKKVILVYADRIVMEDNFEDALASLFGVAQQPPEAPAPTPPAGGGADEPASGRLAEIVARAGRLYERSQRALEEGDFETYGRLIERLGRLLEQAQELSG